MIVVADTSPITYLVQLEVADVLRRLYGAVFIPQAVKSELARDRAPRSVGEWIKEPPDWVVMQEPTLELQTGLKGLDPGERAAIALAVELNANLLLVDEHRARRVAKTHSMSP